MTTSPQKFVFDPRREVEGFEPYLPGRSLKDIKKEFRLKKVVRLAANENALGPSRRAVAAMRKSLKLSHRYPDGFSMDLRQALAKHLGVQATEIIPGTGSDEIIELLGKSYLSPGDEVVVSEHAFVRYQMAAELMGAKAVRVPMKNLTHDLEAMAAAVTDKTKFLFVANPNNPTGTYNTLEQLEELLITLPARVVPVIDEAYFEYASVQKDYPNAVEFFKKGRNLIVLRTFSKIYGLAGLRIGYGVAPENLVQTLDRVRPPYNVSIPAQEAAKAALKDKPHLRRSVQLVEREKQKLQNDLEKKGWEWVPSGCNFLLIRAKDKNGRNVFEQLLRRGVQVRSMEEYGLPEYFRVTVGLPQENKLFLKALKEV